LRRAARDDYDRRVRPSPSPDAFARNPVGRYVAGRSLLVWCHSPSLRGSVYWGAPDEADVQALVKTLELDRDGAVFDVVTDGRRLDVVPPSVFAVLEAYIRARMPGYSARFRRHAIVHPPGLVGTAMTGFYPMLGRDHPWQPFTDAGAAFAWLERPDAARAHTDVEALVERLRGVPRVLQALRDFLAAHPRDADIDAAARTLALSSRSLQRRLREADTSFRAELAAARLTVARQLLATSDDKLETIAERLGYASRAHFSTLFQRATRETPGRFRTRLRAR
jgi:AraC-like DNA-binding protein